MSNIIRRIQKNRTKKLSKRKYIKEPPKYFTSFNIFTQDGQNITVTSERPMTIYEAQYHYKALSISGNN